MANGSQNVTPLTADQKEIAVKFTALAKAKTPAEKQAGFINLLGLLKKMKADPNSAVRQGEL